MAQVKKYKKPDGTLPEKDEEKTSKDDVVTNDGGEIEAPVITDKKPEPKPEPKPERVGSFTLRSDKILGQKALDKINEVNKTNLGIFSSAAARALKDKLDVIVDEQGFRVMDGDTDVTDKYITDPRVARMDDRTFAKNWGATFNTHKHQQRLNFEALWNMDLSEPQVTPPPAATTPETSGTETDGTEAGAGVGDSNDIETETPLPFLEGFDSNIGNDYGIGGITANDKGDGNVYYTIDNWGDRGIYDLATTAGDKIFGNTEYKGGWIDANGRLWDRNGHITNTALGDATQAYRMNPGNTMATWAENAANSGVHIFDANPFQGNWTNYNPTTNFIEGNTTFNNQFREHNKNYGLMDVSHNFAHLGLGKVYAVADPTTFGTSHGIPVVRYFTENGDELTPEQISQINHDVRITDIPSITLTNYGGDGKLGANQTIYGTYSNGKDNTGATIIYERGAKPEEDKYYIYQTNRKGEFRNKLQLDPTKLQSVIDYIKSMDFRWNRIKSLYGVDSKAQTPSLVVDSNPGSGSAWYNGYRVSEKQGGKIDWNRLGKYQWGGAISSNQTTSTVDRNFNNDIQKGHDIKGSEAGLTEAEKLQIAGAIADLSGVLASFAPGIVGGIAGAGAGVTGTALKFAGDVKKDGLDWGDVGRGLLNLAFDVAAVPASFLPAADNAIKGAKLVRTIKSVGAPLLKWMGTIGCASSVINTASKIINGEKYTSEDLVGLAHGLAGGIVAGKQWAKQVGDAKLAGALSSRATSKANANIPTKTGGIENKRLASIVENAKGDKAKITEAIRKELKLSDDAQIDLTKFGIKPGKKGVWEFIARKDARQIFDEPKEQKETKAWEYFFRNRARAQALGYKKPSQSQQNLLGDISQREYDLLMARGAGNGNATISSAVRRAALDNRNAFGFKFEGTKTTSAPWQFGWRNRYRLSKHVVEPAAPAAPVAPAPAPVQVVVQAPKPLALPAPESIVLLPPPREYPIVPVGSTRKTRLTTNSPKFGGKSVKTEARMPSGEAIEVQPTYIRQQIGAGNYPIVRYGSTSNRPVFDARSIRPQNTLLQIEELGTNPQFNAEFRRWANSNPQAARELMAQLRSKFTNARFRHASTGAKDAYFNRRLNEMKGRFGWRFKKGGAIPKFQVPPGGLPGNKWETNINPADFLDLGQFISSYAKSNTSYRHQQDALNKLKLYNQQAVHLTTPTLSTGDIAQKYNAAQNSYNSAIGPNVYADVRLQAANRQAQAQGYGNLAMQEGAETSARIAENNAQTSNILNQNRASEVAAANENLKYQTGLQYQDDMLKSKQIEDTQANIWQPFSYQIRQDVRNKYNTKQQAALAYKRKDFDYKHEIAEKALLKPVYDMYNADTSENKGSFKDWVANNEAAYKKYQEIVNSDAYKKWSLEEYKKQLSFYKSGGSTYKRKSVEEEMAINGDRMSKKAVEKMSDNLHKMLLQLLK